MLTYLLTLCRGVARHCNYLGDILVAFSFSLPCGMRYTTLTMPECLTIFDRWFFGHPPGKFLYMSLNLDLFTCEKSLVFRKDWETTVGWRFCAVFSHKVICRWILMSFQSDVWEQFTSALFLPSISLHSFNLARKKRWSKVLWKVQGGMAGVLQGCTLANFSWNLLDELSVLVPLSE